MIHFFLNKQQRKSSKRENENDFFYYNIQSLEDVLTCRDLMIYDDVLDVTYYSFLQELDVELEKSDRENTEDMKRLFFPIKLEKDTDRSYCEVNQSLVLGYLERKNRDLDGKFDVLISQIKEF